MASPKANTIDIYYTPAPYASQVEHKTVDQGGLLTLSVFNRILTRVPGDIYGGSVGELMPEIEKQDKEMCERWKEEADSYLIFVRAYPTILFIVPYKHIQGRSFLGCRRNLSR
jgi:hypothetical protein